MACFAAPAEAGNLPRSPYFIYGSMRSRCYINGDRLLYDRGDFIPGNNRCYHGIHADAETGKI